MRSLWFVLAIVFPARLAAQNPGDSSVAPDSVRLESLRQEILDRYRTRAHEVLNLSTDQVGRFDSTQAHAWAERRDLMLQRQQINMALRWQMRPGVAASPDSVSRLLESRHRVSESLIRVDDQEDRDMAGFLTPMQRAQYQDFRQRFRERVAEAMRGGRPGMMRPGMRPGRRPRP